MKTIAWIAGISTLLASAGYMIVSLNRWEWNRTLFFGFVLIVAEIGLATGLVLRKLDRLEAARRYDPETLAVLRDTRVPSPDRFAWMKEASRGQLNVFITFLVGGGLVVSAAAWAIDKVASKTATPVGEERLAAQLGMISYPRGGLVVDDVTVLAQDVPGADDAQIRKLLRRGGRL
jgi:hypothetical protein